MQVSTKIDSSTPLIYEGEHVVEHIQRIDEFFDKLEDDLHEVRNYMLALQEFVLESQTDEVREMVPLLTKIISLMRQVLPTPDPDNITPYPDIGDEITPINQNGGEPGGMRSFLGNSVEDIATLKNQTQSLNNTMNSTKDVKK